MPSRARRAAVARRTRGRRGTDAASAASASRRARETRRRKAVTRRGPTPAGATGPSTSRRGVPRAAAAPRGAASRSSAYRPGKSTRPSARPRFLTSANRLDPMTTPFGTIRQLTGSVSPLGKHRISHAPLEGGVTGPAHGAAGFIVTQPKHQMRRQHTTRRARAPRDESTRGRRLEDDQVETTGRSMLGGEGRRVSRPGLWVPSVAIPGGGSG